MRGGAYISIVKSRKEEADRYKRENKFFQSKWVILQRKFMQVEKGLYMGIAFEIANL